MRYSSRENTAFRWTARSCIFFFFSNRENHKINMQAMEIFSVYCKEQILKTFAIYIVGTFRELSESIYGKKRLLNSIFIKMLI